MKARILLAMVGLGLVLFFLPRPPRAVPFERAHFAMGTVVHLKLYEEEEAASRLSRLAFAEIDRIDSTMSHFAEASELSRLNRLAASEPVACSAELMRVLIPARRFAGVTSGAFDITIGALTDLWNFPDASRPPAVLAIAAARASVGYEKLQIREQTVRFLHPDLSLDLGAVAKGYAVDRATNLLISEGARSGLIIAGGDIRYWGEKPDGREWRMGIQHPRAPDQLVEAEDIGLNAVATSGDYEQTFEHGGTRYHHLLDPRTGYPARGCVSVTAWAPTAMEADILSTAVFVLGPNRGVDWIETLPRAETLVFFVDQGELRHRSSSGVAERLHFAEKENVKVE